MVNVKLTKSIAKFACFLFAAVVLLSAISSKLRFTKEPESLCVENSGQITVGSLGQITGDTVKVTDKSIKVAGFYHLGLLGTWKEIFQDQMATVLEYGLMSASEFLYINSVGDIQEWNHLKSLDIKAMENKSILSYSGNQDHHEKSTISILQTYCKFSTDAYVYYFHSKGVTRNDPPVSVYVHDWRLLLEHFLILTWKDCVDALKLGYVACGVNLKGLGTAEPNVGPYNSRHFSGNFWWARCDYVNTLPPVHQGGTEYFRSHYVIPTERHYAEAWLLDTGSDYFPPVRNCYRSNTDHYGSRFDLSKVRKMTCNTSVD